jgi:hypothetical protein
MHRAGSVGVGLDHRARLRKEEEMGRSKLHRLMGQPKRNLATERKKERKCEQVASFCRAWMAQLA